MLKRLRFKGARIGCGTSESEERGASMVEYALLVGLVTVVAVGAIKAFGGKVSTQFSKVNTQI